MPIVDGINTGLPDEMTATQWSRYVTGWDPYQPRPLGNTPDPSAVEQAKTDLADAARRLRIAMNGRDRVDHTLCDTPEWDAAVRQFRSYVWRADRTMFDLMFTTEGPA